jgi:hypothetical protein
MEQEARTFDSAWVALDSQPTKLMHVFLKLL